MPTDTYGHDDGGNMPPAWSTALYRLSLAAAKHRHPNDDFTCDRCPEPEAIIIREHIATLEATPSDDAVREAVSGIAQVAGDLAATADLIRAHDTDCLFSATAQECNIAAIELRGYAGTVAHALATAQRERQEACAACDQTARNDALDAQNADLRKQVERMEALSREVVMYAVNEGAECFKKYEGKYICDPPFPDCKTECSCYDNYARWSDALGLTQADYLAALDKEAS